MNGDCHCGAVTIAVGRPPDHLNKYNCTVCRKLGVLWGYYRAGEIAIGGATHAYVRADATAPTLEVHFCGRCGATTHWAPRDPDDDRRAVNMRLFDPAALRGVAVRFSDAAAWPEGPRDAVYHPALPFEESIA